MARPRSIGGVGWPKLYFDVEPDEEEIRTDLMLLNKKMGDYNMPLQFSKMVIIGDVARSFLRETDPITGEKWRALSRQAEAVPRMGILRRKKTGAKMFRDMTNRFNYGVNRDGVYLNQSRVVEYMPYHQQDDAATSAISGGGVLKVNPERFKMDVAARYSQLKKTRIYEGRPDRVQALTREAGRQVSDRYKKEHEDKMEAAGKGGSGAGGSRIPQRRFLGPSREARKQIESIMDKWARDVITFKKIGGPTSGNIRMRHRPGMKD